MEAIYTLETILDDLGGNLSNAKTKMEHQRIMNKIHALETAIQALKQIQNINDGMQAYKPRDILERAEAGTSGMTLEESLAEDL